MPWIHHKGELSGSRSRPTIQTRTHMHRQPFSMRGTETKTITQSEFVCPENRPQPFRHNHQPPGLQEAQATPALFSDSADSYFVISLPSHFMKSGHVCSTEQGGKVGLSREQSLEEAFSNMKHCSHAHTPPSQWICLDPQVQTNSSLSPAPSSLHTLHQSPPALMVALFLNIYFLMKNLWFLHTPSRKEYVPYYIIHVAHFMYFWKF